jgi:uncharacterized protein YeaO (DUF488 family)
MSIVLKRAYELPVKSDGVRVLVDRLWPRGVIKASAKIDIWAKDLAPSTELRKWFSHDPEKWTEFQKLYRAELKGNPSLSEMHTLSCEGVITLVYAAKDELHTHALVLKKAIELIK